MRNPIQVASKVLEEEMKGSSTLGLIPPIFLAGEGAFQWAMEHGLTTCPDEDLITGDCFNLMLIWSYAWC